MFWLGLFVGVVVGLAVPPIYRWVIEKFFTKKD